MRSAAAAWLQFEADRHPAVDGTPKLLDFGVAKLLDPGEGASDHTMTMAAFLTPEYASPEQVRGENITTGSDVYSLDVLV